MWRLNRAFESDLFVLLLLVILFLVISYNVISEPFCLDKLV